jgi:hypothetical protein
MRFKKTAVLSYRPPHEETRYGKTINSYRTLSDLDFQMAVARPHVLWDGTRGFLDKRYFTRALRHLRTKQNIKLNVKNKKGHSRCRDRTKPNQQLNETFEKPKWLMASSVKQRTHAMFFSSRHCIQCEYYTRRIHFLFVRKSKLVRQHISRRWTLISNNICPIHTSNVLFNRRRNVFEILWKQFTKNNYIPRSFLSADVIICQVHVNQ